VRTLATLPLLLFAACGHEAPFAVQDPHVQGPRTTESPIRLTHSDGDDRTPAWLPDGSAIIYSSERLDLADADRCLNLLPAGGGAVSRERCARGPGQSDSTHRFESPAVGPDGRLAFLRAVSTIGLQKGPAMHFMLGPAGDPDPAAATAVTIVPYAAPSGRTHGNISHLQWLSPTRLVYLGEDLFYQGSTFLPDTFTTGLEIMRLEVGPPISLSVVPGTEYASSVAAGGDDDTIAYTLGGDTRVFLQSLSTGAVSVIHDFGAAGIARDVQLRGNTLVAIVGRSVLFQFEDAHGWVQRDEGGDLHIVNLATGVSVVHALEQTLFRRPALSPDGTALVVEASPFAPVHVGPDSEFNATNHRPDLWLFDLQ
jgi:hypothetical protein